MNSEKNNFLKYTKLRFLLTGFYSSDAKNLKVFLHSKQIKSITEIKEPAEAFERMDLLSFHFIFLCADSPGAKEVISAMDESRCFKKTLILIFSKTPGVYRGFCARKTLITQFCSIPFNIGEFEKLFLEFASANPTIPNKIGITSEAIEHFKKGAKAFDADNLELAKAEIRLCLKADFKFINGYIKMGEILLDLKDIDTAARVLEKGHSLAPDNPKILFLLGRINMEKGKPDAAKMFFNESIKSDPDNAHLAADIGILFSDKNLIDDALHYFDQAQSKAPEYLYVSNHLGIALSKAGRFDEAEGAYRKALAIDDSDSGVCFNLGTMFKRKGDIKKAKEFFRKCLSIDPEMEIAKKMIGQLHEQE